MVIKQVHDIAKCNWCDKEKECVEVELDNGATTTLCWADVKRMAKLTLTQKEKV